MTGGRYNVPMVHLIYIIILFFYARINENSIIILELIKYKTYLCGSYNNNALVYICIHLTRLMYQLICLKKTIPNDMLKIKKYISNAGFDIIQYEYYYKYYCI